MPSVWPQLVLPCGFFLLSLVLKCWRFLELNNLPNSPATNTLSTFYYSCRVSSHDMLVISTSTYTTQLSPELQARMLRAFWMRLSEPQIQPGQNPAFLIKSYAGYIFYFAEFNHHLSHGYGTRNLRIIPAIFLTFYSMIKTCQVRSLPCHFSFWEPLLQSVGITSPCTLFKTIRKSSSQVAAH